jgi:hypothetical protein
MFGKVEMCCGGDAGGPGLLKKAHFLAAFCCAGVARLK